MLLMWLARAATLAIILIWLFGPAFAGDCPEGARALGVSRIVEIDATGGPVFGAITKQPRESSFLKPKEVVLTFDDGPMPGVTKPILDILDRFCTKATFFSVGKMAIAYPELTREILRRGHTLGTHTWSHPMSLPRLKGNQGRDQIEAGFAAVSMAAGRPIAPFFRFPGLNDSRVLVSHLEARGIATFTVDVVSNDSYIADPGRLIERTLGQLAAENGGIALFHDIKPQTARALPTILAEIKARGYRIVHMTSKHPFAPDPLYAAAMREHVAQRHPNTARSLLAALDAEPAPAPAQLPPDAAREAEASRQASTVAPAAPATSTEASEQTEPKGAAASVASAAPPVEAPATLPGTEEAERSIERRTASTNGEASPQVLPRQRRSRPAGARPNVIVVPPSMEAAAAPGTVAAEAVPPPAAPPPTDATSPGSNGIEVIAGSYGNNGRPLTQRSFAAPGMAPVGAPPRPVPVRQGDRPWTDSLSDRVRSGN